MQLDAAIGAAAFLEMLWLECAVFSVVLREVADHISNRDGNVSTLGTSRWIRLTFFNIGDLHGDNIVQVLVLTDVKLRFWSWATRCAASRRWPTPE